MTSLNRSTVSVARRSGRYNRVGGGWGYWEAYRGVIEQYTQTEAAKSAKASRERLARLDDK